MRPFSRCEVAGRPGKSRAVSDRRTCENLPFFFFFCVSFYPLAWLRIGGSDPVNMSQLAHLERLEHARRSPAGAVYNRTSCVLRSRERKTKSAVET